MVLPALGQVVRIGLPCCRRPETGTTTVLAGTLRNGIDNAFGAANPLVIGDTTGNAGTLDLATFNQTVTTLTVNSSGTANNILVGPGKTLTATGNVTIGPVPAATTTMKLTIGGGGALAATSAAGTFQVGGATGGTAENSTLDLTGLASATLSLGTGTLRVNQPTGTNTVGNQSTLLLPTPATGVTPTTPVTTVTAANFNVGDNAGNNGGAGQINSVVLGTGLTTLNVNTVNVGTGGRDIGSITFAAGSNGTLKLRAADGASRAAINVGTGTANTGVAAVLPNTLNLSGHSADLLVSTLAIGGQNRNTARTDNVTFDTGTLDATTVVVGTNTGTANTTAASTTWASNLNLAGGSTTIGAGGLDIANGATAVTGTDVLAGNVNVSGGTVTIANNSTFGAAVRLSNNTVATGLTANGTLNITGGTVTLAGNIIKGTSTGAGTATVTLNGGTLDMGNNSIGGSAAIAALNFQAGTLQNVAQINNGTTALTKTTAGTLTLTGTNAYTGGTVVNAGTLLANSTNATGSGAVTVNSTGILGGTGSIAGPATINTGGTLSPGSSPGTLSFAMPVTFGTGGTSGPPVYLAELKAAAAPVAGTDNDLIALIGSGANGVLTLTNPDTLNLSALTNITGPTTYTIATFASEAGVFDNVLVNGQSSQSANPAGANYALVTYNPTNIQVTVANLTGVPEPASVGLLGVAAAGLLARRRRR